MTGQPGQRPNSFEIEVKKKFMGTGDIKISYPSSQQQFSLQQSTQN